MGANGQDCVLIFRLGSIGDTVVALPCFHGIARAFSHYRRVLLTNALASTRTSSAESILIGTGLVDEVIYYPVGQFSFKQTMALIGELKRLHPVKLFYLAERPDAVSVWRDLVFFKAAGVPKIAGIPWTKRLRIGRIDPKTGELEYEVQRLARTLSKAVPVSLLRADWDLRLSAAELAKADALLGAIENSHAIMAIAPGAKIAAKDWGPDNWASLLKSLAPIYPHMTLVTVGGGDERALCDQIALQWAGPILNLCGMLTPRETAAALRRCKLLVCHDSGPMHLAASQETPCVALFGNYNWPRKWYPFGSGHFVVYEPRGVQEISVQRVASETRRALDGMTHSSQLSLLTTSL
jgi:ADP-heptose:LPS heptosyltransferase